MNLAALRARAREESGILATSIVSDATFNAYINEGYLELARSRAWPWTRDVSTINLTPGTSTYNLAAGVQQVERAAVRAGDFQRVLDQRSASDVDAFVAPAAQVINQGHPLEYAINDVRTTITVYPAPSEAEQLTVVYQKTPATLTDSTSPAFDAQFHHLLAYAGAVKALVARGDDTDRVKVYGGLLQTGLTEMERWYLANRDTAWSVAAGSNRLAWNNRRTGAKTWGQ